MLSLVKLGWNNGTDTGRIDAVLSEAFSGRSCAVTEGAYEFIHALEAGDTGDRLIFAISLPKNGYCPDAMTVMGYFMDHGCCLEGIAGGVIVDGQGEMFTKSVARKMILAANSAGCAFPGRPLAEATGSLYNFSVISKVLGISRLQAYKNGAASLIERVTSLGPLKKERQDILVLHASSRLSSNSLLLWEMIKKKIGGRADITEISMRNGAVIDCRGCSYETCTYYGEKGGCIYGGVMVDKVYPAIIKCSSLVLVCPNYNDAVSANITAFINRLTALFRANDFSAKRIYGLVVSGYSGGDIVAEQIIGAMNCNKNFILPPKFALIETANDPKSILKCEGIEERASGMAERIAGPLR